MPERFVFVSHADSGDVHTLSVMDTGALQTLQRCTPGGKLMPMAQSPCGRWLYVARRSEPMAVITLAIDAHTGVLQALGEAALPGSMAYLSTDRSGRWLFAASYQGNLVSVSPIDAHGLAGAAQQTVPTPPQAHAILASPDNRWVLATSLGGDQVLVFGFDAASGQLTPRPQATWHSTAHAGPRHLRFHPDGRRVYLLNELDATLVVLAFDSAAGSLQHLQTLPTLPPGFGGKPWAADLHLTPDGALLFTSDRASSTLAAFRLDPASGLATLIGHTPTEAGPRGFAIEADGQHLLVVGQQSHHLSRYQLDPASGALTLLQRLPMGQNPNWIETRP